MYQGNRNLTVGLLYGAAIGMAISYALDNSDWRPWVAMGFWLAAWLVRSPWSITEVLMRTTTWHGQE